MRNSSAALVLPLAPAGAGGFLQHGRLAKLDVKSKLATT
jgi:hypothetical protein